MAVLTIKKNLYYDGPEYTVDTGRKFGGFEPGDIIAHCQPFQGVPVQLEIAIRKDGSLIFRSWTWVVSKGDGIGNPYLHTTDTHEATEAQRDTVAGLVSGRIKFECLKLGVGKTLLDLVKPDFDAEEAKCGKKLYFA